MVRLVMLLLLFTLSTHAHEGMWMPSLLKVLNETDMKNSGCKLSAEEIYSVNTTSLKDAVVLFGGGCTGEIISNEGLLVTNHHCGYYQIQYHSSVEHDYLTNGFWAMNKTEELPCPGLTATFIIRIEEVTEKIVQGLPKDLHPTQRDSIISVRIAAIEKQAVEGTQYHAKVSSFYYGNEFYLFVRETFNDVRMVGAPPESIGKFGADADNWVWPRHTGDFSMFRIYANKENKPADYSAENIPYTPRRFFPISLKGVKENDFSMVFGFPRKTTEYLPSVAVDRIQKVVDPIRIKARTLRLAIWKERMKSNNKIRIQYAAKYAGISNYHKKWVGEVYGLEKANALQLKKEEEKIFTQRINTQEDWKKKYAHLLVDFKQQYETILPYEKAGEYYAETIQAIELIKFVADYQSLLDATPDELPKKIELMKVAAKGFFKDYDAPTDKKLFACSGCMLPM
jgi:hypothetical protein